MRFLIIGEEIYDKPELLAKHVGYCPQVHSCIAPVHLPCRIFLFDLFMCVCVLIIILNIIYTMPLVTV